jgi:hypothetical protein
MKNDATQQSAGPILQSTATIEAIFAALDTFITETGYTATTATVNLDGGGSSHSLTANDRAGNSETYTNRVAGVRVAITPTGTTLHNIEWVQFTAAAFNADGSAVAGATFTWSLGQGALGTLDVATGIYTAPAAIATPSTDIVNATLVGGQSWASASVQLMP